MPENPEASARAKLVKRLRDDVNALKGESHPGLSLDGIRVDLNQAANEIESLAQILSACIISCPLCRADDVTDNEIRACGKQHCPLKARL